MKDMLYNVTFYWKLKPICSTLQRATNSEDAGLNAEFRFITRFPNVQYDNVIIKEVEKEGH